MIGLMQPDRGEVWVGDVEISRLSGTRLNDVRKRFAMLFQGAALFDSLSVSENVAFPLREKLRMKGPDVTLRVDEKLEQVGLAGMGHKFPSELSGGMQKRAGLARAMALDPEILFFDEPSAGLDPISSRLLDDLILELRESLGATVVVVTHELASIFAIGNNSVFLDPEKKTMIARGDPKKLLAESRDPTVHRFLTRGEK